MWCRTVRRIVYDYADGVLTPRRSERLRSHLAACGHCRDAEEDARAVTESLAAWTDVPPPEDGLQRLETRLAFLPPLPAARPPAGRLRTFVLPYAAGLATAAVLLLAVVPLFTTDAPGTPLSPSRPAAEPSRGGSEVADAASPDLQPGERALTYVSEDDLRFVPDGQGNLRELPPELRRRILENADLMKQMRERGFLRGLGNPGEIVPVNMDYLEDR